MEGNIDIFDCIQIFTYSTQYRCIQMTSLNNRGRQREKILMGNQKRMPIQSMQEPFFHLCEDSKNPRHNTWMVSLISKAAHLDFFFFFGYYIYIHIKEHL